MNDQDLAALLYPNPPTNNATPTAPVSAAPTSVRVQTTEDVMAERLFGNTNKPTASARSAQHNDRPMSELSEAEQADRLYGATDPVVAHSTAVIAITNAGIEQHLHDPETAREIAGAWAEVFSQHNLNSTESLQVAELGASVLANPPSEETMNAWASDAIQHLKTDFGVTGAGQALRDAQAYVASVPGAADMLDATGLGNHPKVVALAAARGRALRLAGKLR